MIFRRLKAHVEKENWFAVAIDFCIVVIGVFIGIQVANWNDTNQTLAKEAIILEQLHDEFAVVINDLEQTRPYADRTVEAVNDVLRTIRSEQAPDDKAAFLNTIQLASSFGSAPPTPVTLTELLSSGTLSDLSSKDLRQALIRYHRTMQTHDAVADLVLNRISEPRDGFHDAIFVNPDHGTDNAMLLDDYLWERMDETRQQFQVLYYAKSSLSRILEQLQQEANAVMEEIRAAQT